MQEVIHALRELERNETIKISKLITIKENTRSPYIGAMLQIIIQDSIKHRELSDLIIKIIHQNEIIVPEPLIDTETVKIFRKSLEEERKIIELLNETDMKSETKTKALIEYIIDEKQRNHKMLSELIDLLRGGELDIEKYFKIADNLMKRAHQPSKPPRTQY